MKETSHPQTDRNKGCLDNPLGLPERRAKESGVGWGHRDRDLPHLKAEGHVTFLSK